MVRVENKYEARLLDEENAWGKPTEDQEKIVAMTAEINSLKKERKSNTTTKSAKPKARNKTQPAKKSQPKKTKEQKKKTSDKWAWKNKPPIESDS